GGFGAVAGAVSASYGGWPGPHVGAACLGVGFSVWGRVYPGLTGVGAALRRGLKLRRPAWSRPHRLGLAVRRGVLCVGPGLSRPDGGGCGAVALAETPSAGMKPAPQVGARCLAVGFSVWGRVYPGLTGVGAALRRGLKLPRPA